MSNYICILAGGSGTRLWPLSTKSKPKQLLKLFSDKTLIRETYERLRLNYSNEQIFISINKNDYSSIHNEISEVPEDNFIVEPKKMDTLAAIGLIAATISKKDPHANVYIVQCDHYIPYPEELFKIQETTFATLDKYPEKIIAIGTNPHFADTTLGYIEMGEPVDRINNEIIFSLSNFKEKPDKQTAETFVRSWKYLWNLGNYAFNVTALMEEYKKLVPDSYNCLQNYVESSDEYEREKIYGEIEKTSFDIGISEKTKNILVIPGQLNWSDIGSWQSVSEIINSQNSGNTNLLEQHESKNNLVLSQKKVVLLGIENTAIIESDHTILVCRLDKSQELKKIVEKLPEEYL